MSNIVELSCINLAQVAELLTLRACLRPSKRIQLAAWYIFIIVTGSCLIDDSRDLHIRVQTAKNYFMSSIVLLNWLQPNIPAVDSRYWPPVIGAWGAHSKGIRSKLLLIQIRTINNGAAKCVLFVISLKELLAQIPCKQWGALKWRTRR